MLGTYKSPTDIENYFNNTFKLYKKSIVDIFLLQVKDEELKGESCKQYRNFDFYLAVYFVTLIYREVKKYPETPFSYFISKYKLNDLRKCLACNGIDLDIILEQFSLPPLTGDGIQFLEIEKTFEVEPTEIVVVEEIVQIDLLAALNISGCINNIKITC